MAKKTQASAKTAKKAAGKVPVKAKATAAVKKSKKATASPKTASNPKAEKLKIGKKVPAPQVLAKKASPMGDESKSLNKKSAAKASLEKVAQATETTDKIKIDKSMTDEQAKWAEMYNKYKDTQPSTYDMKSTFQAATAIQHKVLGWGWIVSNDNDRLEVLFKDGKRMLISNYRG
jgi:hypothetical protein